MLLSRLVLLLLYDALVPMLGADELRASLLRFNMAGAFENDVPSISAPDAAKRL